MVATNQTAEETKVLPIEYGLLQHEVTGAIWAIKYRGNQILGARCFESNNQPYIEDLPFLIYDVGNARDYAEMFQNQLMFFPFVKRRPTEPRQSADN